MIIIARQPRKGNGGVHYNSARRNWTASYNLIDLETGLEKRVRKSFPTQELARQHLDEILLQKNNKLFIEHNGIPLLKLMKMLLQKKVDSNLITDRAYARILKSIAKKVGIDENISTHCLRHTYGTRCIESGMRAVALQRLMGHTDINVTLNTYTTIFNKYKEEELRKANEYYLNNEIFNNNLLEPPVIGDYEI